MKAKSNRFYRRRAAEAALAAAAAADATAAAAAAFVADAAAAAAATATATAATAAAASSIAAYAGGGLGAGKLDRAGTTSVLYTISSYYCYCYIVSRKDTSNSGPLWLLRQSVCAGAKTNA